MSQEMEMDRDFKDYEDRITRLKRVKKELKNLGDSWLTTTRSKEIAAIETILLKPLAVEEAERLLVSLKDQLKKDYEDWEKRRDRVKEGLQNLGTPEWREGYSDEIDDIESMLSYPPAIDEAEQSLNELKEEFEDYEDRKKRSERVKEQLSNIRSSMWATLYRKEIIVIEATLRNLREIAEAERLLVSLQNQLKGDYEDWSKGYERVKEELRNLGNRKWRKQHNKEIAAIISKFKEPHTIDEAERLLVSLKDQFKKDYEDWEKRCERVKEELTNIRNSNWGTQYDKEIAVIEAKLGELYTIDEAERLLGLLQEQFKKDSEDWIKRCERVKEELTNIRNSKWGTRYSKEIADIEAMLIESHTIDLAERSLVLLQDQIKKDEKDEEPKPVPYFPSELHAQYSSVELINTGGFARVYKATRNKDQVQVALKIPIEMNPDVGRSFKAEIENWRKLDHDNITKFLDYNVYPVYLEMELCNGSLAKIDKPLMVERATFIILEISRGLSHAHKKKIFHTDLKPSNILLLDDVPKISDWGLSKVQSEDGSSLAGSFSPQYAAPEQYSPEIFGKEDERTDIFQLGTIFYQLVTDKLPFRGDHLTQIKNAIIAESPRPPSELNPEAADVEPFILKCLEKKKQDRYQNLSELQDDLANFLGDDFEKSLTLSRNTLEKLTLCSALIEVFAAQKNAQKCLIYLNNLLAYAVTKEFKEMIKEEIEALEFYSSQGVDCKERIPFLEKIIHRARMGE